MGAARVDVQLGRDVGLLQPLGVHDVQRLRAGALRFAV